MNPTQIGGNILAYALQIGLLVGLGAAAPAVLRLRIPRARLLYWQALLAACLVLPWLRPWHSEVITVSRAAAAAIPVSSRLDAGAPILSSRPPIAEIALWLLAAGFIVRLLWLAIGLLKLARYRRHGTPIPLPPEWRNSAQLLVSDEIGGPVTFGFFRPVVLLPAAFPSLSAPARDAILFHELLHVERRDWLFTLCEELLRAVFWFHPAVWWVLGEIQLAREQTVDRMVVDMTQARDPYVDTLLAMAGVATPGYAPQMDLAPAPMFLRRRHLKKRVIDLVQEVGMSKTRLIIAEISALAMMAVACWVITGAIPLEAQAQTVTDGPGVTVNLNGALLMHRTPVYYPAEALPKGVEGTVVVQMRLDSNGEIIDDAVLSGPDELRKAAQQSVLSWHFDKSAAGTTRVVNIDFVKPPTEVSTLPTAAGAVIGATTPVTRTGGALLSARIPANATRTAEKLESISITGLSDSAREQLLAQLPVHVGDEWSQDAFQATLSTIRAFDSHLIASAREVSGGGVDLRIATQQTSVSPAPAESGTSAGGPVRIAGNIEAANLLSQVPPNYPPLAKMARQQGTVRFEATIGTNGAVQGLKMISGPPLLVRAATDAVKQWIYKPMTINGQPVQVLTTVEVNFSLEDSAPAPPQ